MGANRVKAKTKIGIRIAVCITNSVPSRTGIDTALYIWHMKKHLAVFFLALWTTIGGAQGADPASPDLYTRLGLSPGASIEEIKYAKKKLAKKFHPDVSGGSTWAMSRINEAADTLLSPGRVKNQPSSSPKSSSPFAYEPPQKKSAKEELSLNEFAVYEKWTAKYNTRVAKAREQIEIKPDDMFLYTAFYMAVSPEAGWKLDGTDLSDSVQSIRATSPGHQRAINDLFENTIMMSLPANVFTSFLEHDAMALTRLQILTLFLSYSKLLDNPSNIETDIVKSMFQTTAVNRADLVALFNYISREQGAAAFDQVSVEILIPSIIDLMALYQKSPRVVPRAKPPKQNSFWMNCAELLGKVRR